MANWMDAGYAKDKSRRGYSSVHAIDPHDGKRWHLLLSDSKMQWEAKQGMGKAKELGYTVRWALLHPKAVFRGVREFDRDIDEDNWLCYVAIPQKTYDYKTGREVPPWPGEVFLVFVTDERVIYNWYWDKADPYDCNLPMDHENRFTERVL